MKLICLRVLDLLHDEPYVPESFEVIVPINLIGDCCEDVYFHVFLSSWRSMHIIAISHHRARLRIGRPPHFRP